MKAALMDLLCCPRCHARFELHAQTQQENEIVSGQLCCTGCEAGFPIRNRIPRFVSSEAYASTFGFEWKRWRRTQFDSASRHHSASTFAASTGRQPGEFHSKLVLDAGCGAGRYMDLLANAGGEVVGVDLSLAIEVAQENLGHLPNCHFIQADVLQLPFHSEVFDFIYSIGVLDHTPNTRDSFLRLLRTLGPCAEVAIWVNPRRRLSEVFGYFPERVNQVLARDVNYRIPSRWEPSVRRFAGALDWVMTTSSNAQRAFTTRLPPRWLYWLCHVAIPLYYLYRIPLFYPWRLVTRIAMHADPEWRVLDTFDWYSPRYKWGHTYAEVSAWFEQAGLEEITILPRPVSVRGRKPAAPSAHR